MSCSPDKLKDYFFGELDETQAAEVRAHLGQCPACSDELQQLKLAEATLKAVRDEEPPRRTAFVSDKIFEPSWWQRLWQSGPRLGFASAAMLSLAILVHAFAWRPALQPVAVQPAWTSAAFEAKVQDEVAKIVAASEARQARNMNAVIESVRKQYEFDRQADRLAYQDAFMYLQKKLNVYIASANVGGQQ